MVKTHKSNVGIVKVKWSPDVTLKSFSLILNTVFNFKKFTVYKHFRQISNHHYHYSSSKDLVIRIWWSKHTSLAYVEVVLLKLNEVI